MTGKAQEAKGIGPEGPSTNVPIQTGTTQEPGHVAGTPVAHDVLKTFTLEPPAKVRPVIDVAVGSARDASDSPGMTIHYARAVGDTFEAMRENVLKTKLYQMGDAILVWVCEGDFWIAGATDASAPHDPLPPGNYSTAKGDA